MVCWLFVGSSIFSAAFALLGGQEIIEHWVLSLDMTPVQFMILAQVIIFLLGWPLEWTEIIVIFMPIFIPLLPHFNIDPLFFGLLVALNLQTAFLSPPVAMAAFYLKGVSPPHVTLNQIFAGMMPFMGIQVIALVLLYMFPRHRAVAAAGALQIARRRAVARRRARGSNLAARRAMRRRRDIRATRRTPCWSAKSCASRATRCSRRRPTAPVLDAVKVMAQHDIGSLVVMDHGRHGRHADVRAKCCDALADARRHARRRSRSATIYRARPADRRAALDVMELRRTMLERHARYVPVMDGTTLLGVVSFHDVAKAVYEEQSFENRMLKSYIKD